MAPHRSNVGRAATIALTTAALFCCLTRRDPSVGATFEFDALETALESGRLVVVDFVDPTAPIAEPQRTAVRCESRVLARLESGFARATLDSREHQDEFRRLVGASGRVATCVLDADGRVLAVHEGYCGVEDYVERCERAGEQRERVAWAREFAALAPESFDAAFELARALELAGAERAARSTYTAALALQGGANDARAEAHAHLARFAARNGENLVAREHLRTAGELAPARDVAERAATEALALEIERRPVSAAALLERALALGAPRDEASFALARVRRDLGDTDGAIAAIEPLLDAAPAVASLARRSIASLRDRAHGHSH
jgi:hypothetical protein